MSATTNLELDRTYGAIARFETPGELLHAAEALREAGYKNYDITSPYPMHGMDDAMGTGRSILPGFVLCGGLTGTSFAVLLCGWPSAVDYPIIIGGKAYFSIEAFVPIMFELTILFSAFTTLFGMLILNRLPRLHHPVFHDPTFRQRGADDGFFVVVEAVDPKFDPDAVRADLERLGGRDFALIPMELEDAPSSATGREG